MKIGLSGNRFSGKTVISKIFKQMGVPVFHADVVLKFILTHNLDVISEIKRKYGNDLYDEKENINISEINRLGSSNFFDKIIDVADFELRKSYEKFQLDNIESVYTIFNSSILFERGWNTYMDYNINIFCIKKERVRRGSIKTGLKSSRIYDILSDEMDDMSKNRLSEFILNNYCDKSSDIFNQMNDLDKRIVDMSLNGVHLLLF